MAGWIHRFLAAIGAGGHKAEADVSYDPALENHAAGDTPEQRPLTETRPRTGFRVADVPSCLAAGGDYDAAWYSPAAQAARACSSSKRSTYGRHSSCQHRRRK